MKVAGRGRIIDQSDPNLQIEPECAHALGLQKDTMLYAVLLTSRKENPPRQQLNPTEQWITIVASPLPTPSWGNLIRASFTVAPAPGSLRGILTSLNNLGIFCRHIESTNGIDFKSLDFHGADKKEEPSSFGKRVIPSTVMVLEVPAKKLSTNATSVQAVLHKALRNAIEQETPEAIMEAQSKLGSALIPDEPPFVTIDWLSPMQTLNRLGQKSIVSHGQKVTARELRDKLLVQDSPTKGYSVSARPWRRLLWPCDEGPADHLLTSHRHRVFALSHADSDEKIITWNLFSSDQHFITQFELAIPADGIEQEWLRWAFERINAAEGNIITTAMSSRLDGYRTICRLQAIFPIDERAEPGECGDVSRVLTCFREISGEAGGTEEFLKFRAKLPSLRREISEALGRSIRQEDADRALSCNLQNVIIWNPRYDQAASNEFASRFARNPFSFTLPLDLDSYKTLYSEPQARERTRFRLARRIIDRLSGNPGENIAIVGAPRAGKTTVINLVYDLLRQRAEKVRTSSLPLDDTILIPIRINAAVVPPVGLFIEVADQIESWVEASGQEKALSWLKEQLLAARRALINTNALGISVKSAMPGIKGEVGLNASFRGGPRDFFREYGGSSKALRAMAWSMQDISDLQARDFLRSSLEFLKKALTRPIGQAPTVRLVVLVDEVSTLSVWAQAEVMPVWRYVIESRDFLEIRWLISTSRPLEVATSYSPITNVFKEYNVGSLRIEEALRLLSSLSESREENKLAPVATNHARTLLVEMTSRLPYLMQVCCYHIYDRAVRSHIPLITKRLCMTLIKEDVLPEIAEYLEHQWRQVPAHIQDVIKRRLMDLPKSYDRFFNCYPDFLRRSEPLPPQYRKILMRSGLQGEDDFILAPLVALWLVNTADWAD